jgi:DNA-binding NtrC family response regulator
MDLHATRDKVALNFMHLVFGFARIDCVRLWAMTEIDRHTIAASGLVSSNTATKSLKRSCICRVASGPDTGTQISLGQRPSIVGADGQCDLVLSDEQISRQHIELQLSEAGVTVKDLESTNGVYYQGSKIQEALVPVGASLQVGESVLRLLEMAPPSIPPSERERFGAMAGQSMIMREIFAILELASPTDATVLIQGESGTGKELVARALHDHSERANKPFVVVDCSAITENLIDSHLYGHVKGAFTGAQSERKGAFLEANGGTVFLDELGELPAAAQAKLLRVLEAQTVQPVGSDKQVKVNTRVVAATHRDLYQMVQEEKFRFDLFHRLAVIHVLLPPLRDRSEDIPGLIKHFYEGRGLDAGDIAGENLIKLQKYSWPGNVRELRNTLERAWVLGGPKGATFDKLNFWLGPDAAENQNLPTVDTSLPFKEAKEIWTEYFEQRYLASVAAAHKYNISQASEYAGINRRHFRELMQKYGIEKP